MLDPKVLSIKKKFMSVLLVVALVEVIIAWELKTATYSGDSSLIEGGKLIEGTTQYPFEFTVTLEKTTFKPYEQINMTVTLRNIGEESVTIEFWHSPNPSPYWFWAVYDESQEPVFYHKVVTMIPALEEITLQPGGSMQREYAWDQKATDSGQQVPPGIYYLEAKTGFMYNKEEVKLETQSKVRLLGMYACEVETLHFPLRLRMVLDKTIFEIGEPVDITFFLENIGDDTVTLVFSDGHDRFSFSVFDESGSQIYRLNLFYAQVYQLMEIPPDLACWYVHTWWQQAMQGSYHVVGSFVSGTFNITLTTQPVPLTVGDVRS